MKQKNQRQIRKNQLRHDIKQALKYHKKLDRIASGGGTGTDFPIGSNLPCPSCYELFEKEWPRQKYCSYKCRKDKVKLDRARARKAKNLRIAKATKRGKGPHRMVQCKRCEYSFVREHSRQEYCNLCGPTMSTSKGRREYEDATIDILVEERMAQEGWED